jgi:hypothetical protein
VYLALAIASAVVSSPPPAVELDPAAVSVVTPEQFKWRDPTDRVATNRSISLIEQGRRLYIYINRFKPGASAIRTIIPTTASSP